jgi:hypothetical protein
MAAANELMFEGGRRVENLCLQSEAFGTSPWTQTNVSTDANSITAPDGTATADTQTALADNGTRVQTFTIASSPFVFSIYLKRKTGTGDISLSLDGGSTYAVVAVTSEWQRFHIVQTLANPSIVLKISVNGDAVYAWGAQLEQTTGSAYQLPSEYVPTTTAAASKWFTTKPNGSPIYPVPKLLMEGQSRNICLYNQMFETGWTAIKTSLTTSTSVARPDGISSTVKLLDSTDSGAHRLYSGSIGTTIGSQYTVSIYAKAAEFSKFNLNLLSTSESSFSFPTGVFDLSSGTATGGIITSVGNGWYRCSISGTVTLTACKVFLYLADNSGTTTFTGTGTSGIYIFGAQVEASTVPTSFIPTVGSSVTRTADSLSWPLSAELQAMLADAGTLVLDWTPGCIPPASQIGIVSCNAAVDSLLSVAAGASVTRSTDGTTPITGGATLVTNTQRKLIMRWSAASGKYQISSIASGVVTHGTEGDFDGAFTLGTNLLLHYNNAYPAKYSGLKIFSRRLTDAELVRL